MMNCRFLVGPLFFQNESARLQNPMGLFERPAGAGVCPICGSDADFEHAIGEEENGDHPSFDWRHEVDERA
jgi:hypothetical protein